MRVCLCFCCTLLLVLSSADTAIALILSHHHNKLCEFKHLSFADITFSVEKSVTFKPNGIVMKERVRGNEREREK